MLYFSDLSFITVLHRAFPGRTHYSFFCPGYSLEFIVRGKMQVVSEGRTLDLQGPAMFWMEKNKRYELISKTGPEEEFMHFCCDISGPRAERIHKDLCRSFPEGSMIPGDPDAISEIFFEMLKYFRIDRTYYHPELTLCVEKIMRCMADTERPEKHFSDNPYHIVQLGDDIRHDPFRRFNFGAIAARAGISSDHYRRLFRNVHGLSPMEFLQKERMTGAAEMLLRSNMLIKEIVFECHYKSLMDFSRAFKRYFGVSPRAYREQHRKK